MQFYHLAASVYVILFSKAKSISRPSQRLVCPGKRHRRAKKIDRRSTLSTPVISFIKINLLLTLSTITGSLHGSEIKVVDQTQQTIIDHKQNSHNLLTRKL